MYGNDLKFDEIVGKKVTGIKMSEDYLVFEYDGGEVCYTVWGDCCSMSYFFDFYGVKNLLDGGPVESFEAVELSVGDVGYHPKTWTVDDEDEYCYTQVYGYRLTVEHPLFGTVSAVLSFRNESNGYYGGWMVRREEYSGEMETLTSDKIG